ncbi:unannotated protein [freshwater metagenome]|uniref:Unannotated protein n=1 Tax=freshwater metagenome TaxID=449393 RepID=A0A6J7HTH4_9ZZZZ|nr:DUF1795 domain-containing protein [Actinomycetota bacterium]
MRVHPSVPAAAAILALTLGGCGSDDEEPTASTPGGTTATQGAGAPTTTDGTADSGGTAADGGTEITGTGYRTVVPTGWKDASAQTAGTAIRIDRTYAGPPKDGFAANVVIIRENPPSLKGVKIEDVEKQLREQGAGVLGAPVPDAEEPLSLDGEDAVRWTLRRSQGGRQLVQRQLASIHDDQLFTVTLSSTAEDDGDGEANLRSLVDGWKWE